MDLPLLAAVLSVISTQFHICEEASWAALTNAYKQGRPCKCELDKQELSTVYFRTCE